ncbi:DedA family protein [Amycolatopsis sp. NBC_01307]|uniref:DedA family protein n=1 Tax=Amycolatopsis sp. NBC_01307 TaxID=2903561 RepID=UPI002E0FF22D|nr:DedA family protein [Amycolatopsis sp. NBC_01307]
MNVDHWLETIPALSVYLIVGAVIMVESLGIPLPGEVVLVSAAVISISHPNVNPLWVGIVASAGAIIGDSIGYLIGKTGGQRLFAWAGRKFPKHFGPTHIANAERIFNKRGMWAVFLGRFIAFLRILAGPLAGSLRMHYPKFLIANALGGIVWAGGTTALVFYAGEAAKKWLGDFSKYGLIAAIVIGIVVFFVVKKRLGQKHEGEEETPQEKQEAAS